jgi:tryptophan-rich sensory protein
MKVTGNKNIILIPCIFGCIVLGSLPTLFSTEALQNWFPTINKPSWNPPNWLFGPVWTILFLMMGVALWQIIISEHPIKAKALQWYTIQFILNMLWTILFFTLHSPGAAFIEIIFLWLSINYTIVLYSKIKKSAAYLLLPYICWVSFAAILNATIYWLNG